MASRGVLFALTDEQQASLRAAADDDARIEYVQEEIEGAWDEDNLVETDKAWDAIHRALAREDRDSGELALKPAENPLALVILGGQQMLDDEANYIIRLIEPAQLPAIVGALRGIDQAAFRVLYDAHCLGVEPEYDDADGWNYTWHFFEAVRAFFLKVEGRGRAVVFTVDL